MRHKVPKFGMVTKIHLRLLSRWKDLHSSDQNLIRKYLGNFPTLLEVQPNNTIIEAATLFWDYERVVFRFRGIEMTLLLEEIGRLADLVWETPGLLMPKNHKGRSFLKMMGLKKNLACLKDSYIPFDYLYERYGHNKSYRTYSSEFSITSIGHVHCRIFVFIFCFLGLIVFLMKKGRIHTRLAMLTKTLMEGIGGQTFIIVPMIIGDIPSLRKVSTRSKTLRRLQSATLTLAYEHLQNGKYRQEIQCRD